MAFANTWAALQASLIPGLTVPNWTFHNGTIGEPFLIEEVRPNVIVVHAPGATSLQPVGKKDFEAVYALWDDYAGGAVSRQTFNPLTRYSKYVISILHWLQQGSGGRLP